MVVAVARVHAREAIRTVKNVPDLLRGVLTGAHIHQRRLALTDVEAFKGGLPTLVANVADFGDKSAPEPAKALSAWIITEAAQQLGVRVNSPNALYAAIAEDRVTQRFAVPAVNVRGNSLDTARAMFAAAIANNVGALIVEIARSEIGYTNQDPREFAAVIQAAAILEGRKGPLFLQGDHIQLNAAKVRKGGDEAAAEEAAHSALIRRLLTAGFGSLDLDMSPLEDRKPDASEISWDAQQRANYEATARKVLEVRRLERELGLPYAVMLGGETGEVGKMNTRREDVEAYAQGLVRELQRLQEATGLTLEGIRKVAVQTGTSHGGVRRPDGTLAKVKIDFDVLAMVRQTVQPYGWAGPVQHGASTLPDDCFNQFVAKGAVEVHLATGFQNILFEGGVFQVPGMQAEVEHFLVGSHGKAWKPADTFAKFAAEAQKQANGPFKLAIWTLPDEVRAAVSEALYAKFAFLFGELGVGNTRELVDSLTPDVEFRLPYPELAETVVGEVASMDEGGKGLSD